MAIIGQKNHSPTRGGRWPPATNVAILRISTWRVRALKLLAGMIFSRLGGFLISVFVSGI